MQHHVLFGRNDAADNCQGMGYNVIGIVGFHCWGCRRVVAGLYSHGCRVVLLLGHQPDVDVFSLVIAGHTADIT